VTNNDKVYVGLNLVSVKYVKLVCKRQLHGKKTLSKGKQKWEKTCITSEMLHRKLKTPIKTRFVNKVITFEETLEFKQILLLCYERQNKLILQ
jgi:hypothetical protein